MKKYDENYLWDEDEEKALETPKILPPFNTELPKERALLVALGEKGQDVEDSLDELEQLALTANLEVLGRISQHRDQPEKGTLIGAGKAQEVKEFCANHSADVVIFDNELSGIQIKNLQDITGCRVIDRSMLILDIFAARAQSHEGKLQVELAQLKYNLPRLVGIEKNMAKMRMGVGMRGPGEKKLETDRRHIRTQVRDLEMRLKKLEAERNTRRAKRRDSGIKNVALVGYTNAGKSSLMNVLARADVPAEDKLFATLDPVTRRVSLDYKTTFTLTDTVGFINKLPHEFINAFKSTLEEARQADLLLHVLDASSEHIMLQCAVVMRVLKEMEIENKPIITVYNKIDLHRGFEKPVKSNFAAVSALTGEGIEELKALIAANLGVGV